MFKRPRSPFPHRHRRRADPPAVAPTPPTVPPRMDKGAPTPPATRPRRVVQRPQFKRCTKMQSHTSCDRGGHYDRGIWQGPF
jgi:hypothetical protein